ncbi:hypothetical protein PMAYCL1PPCAC_20754, partial [Pristionchus mayeri]
LALSSLTSGSFNAKVQGLKILIASDILHSFNIHRLDGTDQRKDLLLHLKKSIEQVADILKRPVCQETGAHRHKHIFSCISALKKWKRIARNVMKKYAKDTSDSSSGESSEEEDEEENEE